MAGPAYQWGHWRFEPTEFRLLRDGAVVPLPAKTLDLLFTLLKRAPRLVTKEEILAAVWPDAAVEEGNIAFHVAALRKVLDEDEDSSAIETVRGKGSRFVRDLAIHQLPPTDELTQAALARAYAEASASTAPAAAATPEPAVPAVPTPSPVNARRRLLVALAVVVVSSLGGFAWWRSQPAPYSIAVRPFEIITPPAGQENFPDGLRTYLLTKLELAGVAVAPLEGATAVLSGQLQPLDGGFRVTVQLTRRRDNARVWDWSFDVPRDVDLPPSGKDDARSRLQGAIATRTAEGVKSFADAQGTASTGGRID
jgi:DNA-binding winged helix-turn-helix (wHTH) protein/TolB-like protein